jgi:hypothetical protein
MKITQKSTPRGTLLYLEYFNIISRGQSLHSIDDFVDSSAGPPSAGGSGSGTNGLT